MKIRTDSFMLLVLIVPIFFLPNFFVINVDSESFMSTILSTQWFSKELWAGNYAFWTNNIGFGMPQPFSQYLWFHPLMPVFGISPMLAIVLLYIGHLSLGCYGVWLLGDELRLTSRTRQLCCLTFLFSSSSLNYTLTDFWPAVFVTWAILPFVLLFIHRLLQADSVQLRLYNASILGLTVGFETLNSHAGVFATYAVSLVLFTFFHGRSALRNIHYLIYTSMIAAGIAASKIVYHSGEMALFAKGIFRTYISSNFFSIEYLSGAVFGPLFTDHYSVRILWFGTVFLGLALLSLILAIQFKSKKAWPFVLLFLISPFLISLPREYGFNVIAWPIAFRDPAIICGILLAGIALDWLKKSSNDHFRKLAGALALLQVVVLVVSMVPGWMRAASVAKADYAYQNGTTGSTRSGSVKSLSMKSPFVKWLEGAIPDKSKRLYYSPGVISAWKEFPNDIPVWRNMLAYHGFKVVPGYFKGVSYDSLYPDHKLMHGQLRSQATLIEQETSLEVLGIQYVIAMEKEVVAPNLRPIAFFQLFPNLNFVLYENPQAWAEAVVLSADTERSIPLIEECEHTRALCSDFSDVRASKKNSVLAVENSNSGDIQISMKALSSPSLLLVTTAYRPDWVATSGSTGKRLKVVELFNAFIGIEVPSGTDDLRLCYQPVRRMLLDAISWGLLVVVGIGCVVMRYKLQRTCAR